MTNEHDGRNGRGNDFLMGLLTGGIVGAALGMFFAPRAAAELRHLADSATRLGAAASERYRQASTRVGEAVDEFAEKGRAAGGKVLDAVARGAHDVERYATDARTTLDRGAPESSGRQPS